MRFGLGGGCPKKLREIGEALGGTREGVRQLELRALAGPAKAFGAQSARPAQPSTLASGGRRTPQTSPRHASRRMR
ncbi:MAG TPA: hypothetical protein VFE78_14750 [Gemmataceae bacterium]|nr:hypothetical protein [Gemmataceae bacterium]